MEPRIKQKRLPAGVIATALLTLSSLASSAQAPSENPKDCTRRCAGLGHESDDRRERVHDRGEGGGSTDAPPIRGLPFETPTARQFFRTLNAGVWRTGPLRASTGGHNRRPRSGDPCSGVSSIACAHATSGRATTTVRNARRRLLSNTRPLTRMGHSASTCRCSRRIAGCARLKLTSTRSGLRTPHAVAAHTNRRFRQPGSRPPSWCALRPKS